LYSCAERWEKVDERLFILEKDEKQIESEKKIQKTKHLQGSGIRKYSTTVSEGSVTDEATDGSIAVYDPVTGKKVRKDNTDAAATPPEEVRKEEEQNNEPHNMLEFSPLSNFSTNDLRLMGKEVDDACSEGDERSLGNSSSSDSEEDTLGTTIGRKRVRESSSEDESMSPECPKGWKPSELEPKRQRIAELEEDGDSYADGNRLGSESGSSDDDMAGEDDDEMAAELEREFLEFD
jgi:hypothetical protein